MQHTIHIRETLESYVAREMQHLENQYGSNPLYFADTYKAETAFDIGYYLALKRIKERLPKCYN